MARSWASCATSGCLPSSNAWRRAASSALICCLTSASRALSRSISARSSGRHLRRSGRSHQRSPVAPADDDVRAQVVQHQQRADAVGVRGALVHQPRQFAVRAARVFVLGRRLVQHRPHTLAGVVAQQHRQQLVAIEPIGLGAPGAPVHLDARGVDHDVVDALLDQPAVQPPAVAAGLVAGVHLGLRRSGRSALAPWPCNPAPRPCRRRRRCTGSGRAGRRSIVNFHDLSPSSKLMYSSPWVAVSLPCRTVWVVVISVSFAQRFGNPVVAQRVSLGQSHIASIRRPLHCSLGSTPGRRYWKRSSSIARSLRPIACQAADRPQSGAGQASLTEATGQTLPDSGPCRSPFGQKATSADPPESGRSSAWVRATMTSTTDLPPASSTRCARPRCRDLLSCWVRPG